MELEEKLRALLGENVHPLWLKADSRIFEPLINEFLADKRHRDNKDIDLRQLIIFFNKKIGDGLQNIYDLRRRHTEFIKRHARALSVRERRQYILDYAKYLGATDQQLKEDRQAFSRWFGADTMTDRYLRLYSRSERKIAVYLKHLGNLVAKNLQQDGESIGHSILWKHLNLESIVKPLLAYDGDSRINIEAFQCLSCALRVLPRKLQQEVVDASTTQYIYRSALESKQQVWIQCEALSLLQSLSPESFYKVLEKRLTQPLPGDDIFVRRHLIRLLGKNLIHIPELAQLFPVIAVDVSPFVRQEFARAICHASNKDVLTWIRHLAIHDESPQVRAVALLELTNHIQKTDLFSSLLQLLIEVLDQEQDTFVLRVALKVIGDDYEKMEPDAVLFWRQKLQPSISKIHTQAENLSVRRWAAQAREKLWLNSDPEARELAKQLQREMAQVSPGEDCELPKNLNNLDEKKLGRVLSILGQQDFGYDISHGLTGSRITRGHRFGFRLWRFLHELRHPAPDKRQAF
ncbi:MAG: HEAT repeat domain-containing protein, partial [Gammaproteobacteria bacterium]|nr:HEAT repeat domain-containing protein [Gammaproteobacteria bacterium]